MRGVENPSLSLRMTNQVRDYLVSLSSKHPAHDAAKNVYLCTKIGEITTKSV